MSKIFLISGLGADRRLFKNIELPDHEIFFIDWIVPDETDTLTSYSQKVINQFNITENSIVIGVSLGGMIAVEIAKKIHLKKVILISSIKSTDEAPAYFTFFRKLPVYKTIPGRLFNYLGFMVKPLFGDMKTEDADLFKDMLKNSSPVFLKWAMRAALYRQNDKTISNLYHIAGDCDRVFPIQHIKNPTATIKGGTHIMVFDRANEINNILNSILSEHETA
ncbi:alpha/beta hydrolase [Mucilaginibacter segetis]|uniref:Alpha/beta hydrolase n=1 Tax=Mucilaginibacter segetis TaxID=2793071 RepID=A0A934PTU3_9SPHI|nr:alpha/beta hydrolase [Mucilaginibacter segetis]MBK0379457.1 alpha/beta hydrolase [Mucilaginibacter segetis]